MRLRVYRDERDLEQQLARVTADRDAVQRENERLRNRTHEIQAEEMAKRAELDSEIGRLGNTTGDLRQELTELREQYDDLARVLADAFGRAGTAERFEAFLNGEVIMLAPTDADAQRLAEAIFTGRCAPPMLAIARAALDRLAGRERTPQVEIRSEDLIQEFYDVPDQSVIDTCGRGVKLTHKPTGSSSRAIASGRNCRTRPGAWSSCRPGSRRERRASGERAG